MKDEILHFIKLKHQEKINTRFPQYITFQEINIHYKPVDARLLREMVDEGLLITGRTISDVWFKPIGND